MIIKDTKFLPQDATFYLDQNFKDTSLVSPEKHIAIDNNYRSLFFSPWHIAQAKFEPNFKWLKGFNKNLGYNENNRKNDKEWFVKVFQNMDHHNYPNTNTAGITIINSNLRLLPTNTSRYAYPIDKGDIYALDTLQNSRLFAYSPIFVSQISQDGEWALVETASCSGWLPLKDIAYVDRNFIEEWEGRAFVVITKDDSPIDDGTKHLLFTASLGQRLPLIRTGDDAATVLIAKRNQSQEVQTKEIIIPMDNAKIWPMPLTPLNIANMINQLVGCPYSWGGKNGYRDCSSTLQDLFAIFGLWLPRNSAEQVIQSSKYIDLRNLSYNKKETIILETAAPFLTLLYCKNHIMLYLGQYHRRAVVFHNILHLNIRNFFGLPQQYIIGSAIISTLEPGLELYPKHWSRHTLLARLEGMSLLLS